MAKTTLEKLPKKIRDMSSRELISEYTFAVRITWQDRRVRDGRNPGHVPEYQRELAIKREILRRLS
jgi:hypothetical protein